MSVRAAKSPSLEGVPVGALIKLAQDPEGFQAELERYAVAAQTAAEAEAQANKAKKEADERMAALTAERAAFMEDQKRAYADLNAKQNELATGWAKLKGRERDFDERLKLLEQGEAEVEQKRKDVASQQAGFDDQQRIINTRSHNLDERDANLKRAEEAYQERLKALEARIEALRAPL